MVDYTRTVNGGTGTMLIRDQGYYVEFHITAGNSIAYDYDLNWGWNANGGAGGGTFRYEAGMGWRYLGAVAVGYSQTVRFYKLDSGSIGLGGLTEFDVYISRSTVPPAPNPIGLDQIEQTSMRYRFSSAGDGGSGILEWQVQYGINGSGTATYVSSGGTTVATNLVPGKLYNFYSRGRNANGWGPWSSVRQAKTIAGARIKVAGVWKEAVPYVKVAGVWKIAQPFIKVAGVWKKSI